MFPLCFAGLHLLGNGFEWAWRLEEMGMKVNERERACETKETQLGGGYGMMEYVIRPQQFGLPNNK